MNAPFSNASFSLPALLLVEDDETEAIRLESVLSHLGYRCTRAGNGDTALEWLARTHFDVVLLDLVVPGLDGLGLLDAMRQRGLNVPVVAAVTGAGVDAAAGAIRAGARDFVVKPAGALRLEVALGNAVALGRARASQHHPRPGLAPCASRAATAQAGGQSRVATVQDGHIRPLDMIEADLIRFACHLYEGRLTEVARRLGIGRSTLYRKLARISPDYRDDSELPSVLPRFAPQIVAAE